MKLQELSPVDALKSLVTTMDGLDEAEAKKRLDEFGPNLIKEVAKKSLLLRFLSEFTHFLALLLWTGAGLAFVSEYFKPGEGMLALGLAIVFVIFINAVFTFTQEYKAERALNALKEMLPFMVKVVRGGKRLDIEAKSLVPGDVIIIEEGDKIPADSRVIECSILKVNNSALTGESEPVLRNANPSSAESIESPNVLFAGTTVVSGSGRAVVYATGMRTEFGRIAHLTASVESGPSPLQREIVKVTRIVAFIAVVMGAAFFVIGMYMGRTLWENYLFAIGIIVANVPEGLLPTVTLALAMGSRRMAERKALIKTLTSVETLGCITVICTDKTGTLTQNKMTVKSIWPIASQTAELMRAAYLCNNARYENGVYKGDSTETALLSYARSNIEELSAKRISEIPFDSERKRMTTVNVIEGQKFSFSKGAIEGILSSCDRLIINGVENPIDDDKRAIVLAEAEKMMGGGERVIGFAYKKLADGDETAEEGMIFAGLIGLEDPPRPEVSDALRRCRDAGIRVIMITGDASATATAIAKEIGMIEKEAVVVEGARFRDMSDDDARKILVQKNLIFSRMTPKSKMRVVQLLSGLGEVVAVTGDGVNDAPALKKADIGVAMGIAGTDVAKEAADMILLDDNFATIVNAVEEGRAVYENIRKFISYIFSSNIPEVIPYLGYVLLNIPLSLTIMQILAVDLGTDMVPALALGAERPTKDLMKNAPRSKKERLLSFSLLSRAYLFLGPLEAVAGMYAFFMVLSAGGWVWNQPIAPNNPIYMQATTACLTAIIICQVGNVFACRSFKQSLFTIGFFTNKLIFIGIAVELLIQAFIVYHPLGNKLFSTYPISGMVWLSLLPFGLLMIVAEEARKAFVRRFASGVFIR